MNWIARSRLIGGILGAVLFVPSSCAGKRPDHPYRYSDVDMPVSLAVGTVRTPEFPVVNQWYWILLQVEKPLPFQRMRCMMGVTSGAPIDSTDCRPDDPLLRAEWTVWDGDHVVMKGSSTTKSDDMYTDKYIFKFLGKFPGAVSNKYVVEVKFTKDGSPLNVANPHLIITKIGRE
jgi:hypothetical protein